MRCFEVERNHRQPVAASNHFPSNLSFGVEVLQAMRREDFGFDVEDLPAYAESTEAEPLVGVDECNPGKNRETI